jgi:hypothetical protein
VQVEWFEEGIRICRSRTKSDFGVPTSSRLTLSFSCLRFIMLSRALEIFHNEATRYMECYQDEYEYEYGLMHRGI